MPESGQLMPLFASLSHADGAGAIKDWGAWAADRGQRLLGAHLLQNLEETIEKTLIMAKESTTSHATPHCLLAFTGDTNNSSPLWQHLKLRRIVLTAPGAHTWFGPQHGRERYLGRGPNPPKAPKLGPHKTSSLKSCTQHSTAQA